MNDGYSYSIQIPSRARGQSVLSFLADRFDHSTAVQWRERIEQGEVTVNENVARVDTECRPGDRLVWNRPGWIEADVPLRYSIEFEDDRLLVVDKPSGLPTLPGGGFLDHTLLNLVRKDFPSASPLHRLGRCTSGLVMMALDSMTATTLSNDWPNVLKQYSALASGVAAEDIYDIQTPIGPVDHPRLGKVHAANDSGKPSRSVARVVERYESTTLFEVDLHTGRPHQIRIHLASIGHRLVGDPLYDTGGIPRAINPGLPGDGGYFLRAQSLTFTHPISGSVVTVAAGREGWQEHG
ncbi:Ribosomal large subunit pseudouridine synthase D [Rubripirellula amarantea]|uniref:Pseudouridine synthase n=1 Tax=Rubripirellula amarantea TaxID=2527999 RepID=A0A5C5WHH4_9BACT|nr:RluA family pseudouridine synthase [Rubripirellula amarantea]TWT50238.1 Ribosomal large subunit pseudouridine synthase D [Rubripirellula amarantea]